MSYQPRQPAPIDHDVSDSSADDYEDEDNAVEPAGDPSVEYPATELIKELLAYVSAYEKLGRHVNLSRQLNTRSNASYKAINRLIAKLFTGQQSFEESFKDFSVSSNAIPILERILLDCYFADPSSVRRHVPDGDDVVEGITFIETYFADRRLLAQALDKFTFEGLHVPELQQSYLTSISADNIAALEAIVKYYQQYSGKGKVQDRDIYGRNKAQPVTELQKAVATLYPIVIAKPAHGAFLEIVLKSLMLSAIPFHLLEDRVTKNPLATDYKNHLKNYEIWKAMLSLTIHITEVAKSGANDDNLATLKDEYEALKKLLLKVVKTEIDNLKEIIKLMQLAAYIRRPFHARTAALIKAVYYLDLGSDQTNIGGRYELNEMLKAMAGMFTETRDAVKDVRTIYHLSDLYKSQTEKYQKMYNSAKQCSRDLNLTEAWDKHEAAYQTAVAVDKKNLDDAAKFLSISKG